MLIQDGARLLEAGHLLNFHHFQQVVCSFSNKREDVKEQNYNCSLKVYFFKRTENSVFREFSKYSTP